MPLLITKKNIDMYLSDGWRHVMFTATRLIVDITPKLKIRKLGTKVSMQKYADYMLNIC